MNEHNTPTTEHALREAALEYHRLPTRGKLSVAPTKPLANQRDLSLAYSPGVAYPCLDIEKDPRLAAEYTARGNLVGVITNGTAVLGLGDIGPLAAKPVMEGKACLFKKFAGIDVFDIELAEKDPDKLVEIQAIYATHLRGEAGAVAQGRLVEGAPGAVDVAGGGVAGIQGADDDRGDAQAQQRRVQLARVHPHRPGVGLQAQDHADVRAHGMAQQRLQAPGRLVHLHHLGLQRLPAGEGQQALGQLPPAARSVDHHLRQRRQIGLVCEALAQRFGAAVDHCQQLVEVLGHAPRQLGHDFQALHVADLPLQ